ncbi:MAG: phosphoglucosamine mutase, partial [Chloroflexota bacterium]|nr:phosphoglucosamine mutase [Chloroflexota bacterium]
MPRLFGTDGIRGIANRELDAPLAYRLGRAVGELLDPDRRGVLIGQDTRRSGDMFVAATAAGLAAAGSDAVFMGVVTTPCLAHATANGGAAGIMVSASHNPATDNGLKVLVGGRKPSLQVEDELELLMRRADTLLGPGNDGVGTLRHDLGPIDAYLAGLRAVAGDAFRGLRVALDCANGSASRVAPRLFESLGADVTASAAAPDGTNINRECGATHPEALQRLVRDTGVDVGLAFDGDADRLIAVDERGVVVDGDGIMGICALDRLARGTLPHRLVVATVLSNGGLDRAVAAAGGHVVRTAVVGDRAVAEEMERRGAALGGEQSGHVVFAELATTGDGMLTAIELVKAMRAAGRSLSELASRIPKIPQVMLNSAAGRGDDWQDDPEFSAAVERATAAMG